jgi:uncharacterized damage-inducible protein DinB
VSDAVLEAEPEALLRYLDRVREAVIRASEGLTDSQQRAPGVPSGTNLLGLIQHLTWVEEHWYQRVFLGEDPGTSPEDPMDVPADVTRAQVVSAYRKACARSNQIVRGCPDLSAMSRIPNPGEDDTASLRRITAHMIEETARHAGHADILREQIDGATDL